MWVDERDVAFAAASFAAIGIALLLLLSETARDCGIGEALLLPENSLVRARGTVKNVTDDRFLLCEERLCATVRKGETTTSRLVGAGQRVEVTGRVRQYRGIKYLEASWVEAAG